MNRKTNFVLVLNNYDDLETESLQVLIDKGVFRYLIAGKEVGEEGTPHLQCFARTKDPVSIAALQHKITNVTNIPSRWAIKVAEKGVSKNIQYCSKGEQSKEEWNQYNEQGPNFGKNADVTEYGAKPPGSGKRTDLDDVAAAIRSGMSEREVADKFGSSHIKYFNGIREHITVIHGQARDHLTVGFWCFGPTGSGKSRWAHGIPGEKYVKDPSTRWFDFYQNEETVIVDDYRPNKELTFNRLLNLADRYPMLVERKGGSRHFNAQRIIVTCPHDIDTTFQHLEFLQGDIAQLKRRFCQLEFGPGKLTHHLTLEEACSMT